MTINCPNNFTPRPYQIDTYNSISKGYKRVYMIWHRRAGKDKVCVSILAKEMLKRVGAYYYIFPLYTQGKKALWKNRDKDGFRTIEHIPKELWKNVNSTEMSIELTNGSIFQVLGSENIDSLVGTNPVGIVLSEWALQDPQTLDYLEPIVAENDGFIIFNTTPRGDNHASRLWKIAQDKKDRWFTSLQTVDDTGVISGDDLVQIRQESIARYGTDAMFRQEYYCSFDTPVTGAVYGAWLNANRFGNYSYNEQLPVYTAWDLGASDTTAIWFYQMDGNNLYFIDHYETFNAGMKHFVEILRQKNYNYAKHYLPHDANARRLTAGEEAKTIVQMLSDLGLRDIEVLKPTSIMGGIEEVRSTLSRCFFDSVKCERGILALKEYSYDYSEKNQIYSATPKHDWSSHSADAFRYAIMGSKREINEFFDPNLFVENTFSTF